MARGKSFLSVGAICLIASTVPSASALSAAMQAAELVGLLPRASTGCSSGYTACNQDGLPGNFCCPSGESCFVFNTAQSVICCPPGKDCSSISTISCDLNLQNATFNPTSPLFTTQLQTPMNACGTGCCPTGMTCKNGQTCVANPQSSSSSSLSSTSVPSSTSASTPASPSATSSPSSSDQASPTTASSESSSSAPASAPTSTHNNQFPTAAILVGFFSGLVTGIILTATLICCVGRSKKKSDSASQHSDFSNLTANISDPIYQDGNSRADFLRRESKSRDGVSRAERVKSFFRTPTVRSHRSQAAMIERCGTTMTHRTQSSTAPPKTPSTLRHQASGESITIYSPPNLQEAVHAPMPSMTERNTTVGSIVEKADARSNKDSPPNTDFEKMLAEVGWRTGQPYLGSPGMVDPRSRRIGEV